VAGTVTHIGLPAGRSCVQYLLSYLALGPGGGSFVGVHAALLAVSVPLFVLPLYLWREDRRPALTDAEDDGEAHVLGEVPSPTHAQDDVDEPYPSDEHGLLA
jgi:hypothetical protein